MLADKFWAAVSLIYVGFLALAFDPWIEPKFRHKTIWLRISVSVVVVALAGFFSWAFVFVSCPLAISGVQTPGSYPAGQTISGIQWKPEFTEVQLWIRNQSDVDYEDINILVRPAEPVVAIAQASSVPGVSFEDNDVSSMRWTNTKSVIPSDLLATDAGYRVRCPHLQANTTIALIIAVAEVKSNPTKTKGQPLENQFHDRDYVLKERFSKDFSTYWYGHRDGDVYLSTGHSQQWIVLDGAYTSLHRRRSILKTIEVGGSPS